MIIIPGNALLFKSSPGWNLLAHVVNDVGAFGAGFALQLAQRWPDTKKRYLAWRHSSTFRLGNIEAQTIEMGFSVVHLLCQQGLPARDNPQPLHYGHLSSCLVKLGQMAEACGEGVIHVPKLGCGYGGAQWFCVAALLEKCIPASVPVFVYDLPKRN